MVVRKKKRNLQPLPDKYKWDGKYVADYDEHTYTGNAGKAEVARSESSSSSAVPLYAVCWGWNAAGRAGNATAVELRLPRMVHKSTQRKYIACAAGSQHSLLVSDRGIVYSFGDGRKGQLGYGNDFMHQPGVKRPKGGIVQSFPRQVNPSGSIQFGHDLKIAQVGCGRGFSIAREMTHHEGVAMVQGLAESEASLDYLRKVYFDSDVVQFAWANVRQERCQVNRVSQGNVTSWGTGKWGELGFGAHTLFSPRPQVIPKFRHINIVQIATGRHHVLAVSNVGNLYSWGSGRSGKLGHSDYEDRQAPEFVQFFEKFFVEFIAAGDAHSAVLTTNRKGIRETQLKRVATFGRGAHGRLGNGSNRSSPTPVAVTEWQPSLLGVQFRSLACGGAHTLALAYTHVPKTRANPWGIQTFVVAWGYGGNGQLGNGYLVDTFIPLRARMPKSELISEISAGRSWSMARTIGGDLFTWGKGLRGQLGQGIAKFCFAPKKLDTFASFIALGSSYAHNVCISVPRKILNRDVSLEASKANDVFAPLIDTSLKKREAESLYTFDCCRRHINPKWKAKIRYVCRQCDITSICIVCAKQCHRGHDIVLRKPPAASKKSNSKEASSSHSKEPRLSRVKSPPKNSRVISPDRSKRAGGGQGKTSKITTSGGVSSPVKVLVKKGQVKGNKTKTTKAKIKFGKFTATTLQQTKRKMGSTKVPFCKCGVFNKFCRVIPVIPEGNENEDPDPLTPPIFTERDLAAIRIQRLGRRHNGRRQIQLLKMHMAELRREISTKHYFTKILEPIWQKLDRAKQKFWEQRELLLMSFEEDSKKKFDYFYGLQGLTSGLDALAYGTKKIYGNASVFLPRIKNYVVSNQLRPSFAFSWASVRQQQLLLHPSRRVPIPLIAELTRLVPRHDKTEGRFFDPDVFLLFSRYLRDSKTEKWRRDKAEAEKRASEAKEKRAEMARKILMSTKFASKAILAKVEAMSRAQHSAPSIPPPPEVLAAQALAAKIEKLQKEEEEILAAQALEDAPFDMFSKKVKVGTRRRNSISAPDKIYRRLVTVQDEMPIKLFAHRRNSLPARVRDLCAYERPTISSFASAKASTDIFDQRALLLAEYLEPKYQRIWDTMTDRVRKKRVARLLGYNWLSPRLPREMLQMLEDGNRRRTIGEPERLSKQMSAIFQNRSGLAKARAKAFENERMRFRRRSFDYGEEVDAKQGVTRTLGDKFEEPYHIPTLSDMRKDSALMEVQT